MEDLIIQNEILRPRDLESVSQAAKRAGLSPGYLYRLVHTGKLHSLEIGGKIMLYHSEVSALMRKRKAA